LRRWLAPAMLLGLLIGAWQIAAATGAIAELLSLEPYLVPSPAEIAQSLWENRGLLVENAWVTLREMVIGIFFALVVGVGFAIAMHRWRVMRDAAYPLIIASQTIPILVIAPILTVWFGYGIAPKVVIIALVCFFPVTVNLYDGLRAVDAEQRKLLRALHASRWQMLRMLELPAALPQLFTGLKVAAAVSVIGAVFAEWSGSESGLGHTVLISSGQLESARTFAATVLLFALAVAVYGAFAVAERRLVPWAHRTPPGGP
jgi:ABC-type nitrate/sulfonate/bicarbonate transport system permease component